MQNTGELGFSCVGLKMYFPGTWKIFLHQLITISDIQILNGQRTPVLEVQLMVGLRDQVTLSTLQETMFEENSVNSGISNK